jgi:hypothetical protein
MGSKKKYDKEFKLEAIRLALEPGNTASKIEKDLSIGQGVFIDGNANSGMMVNGHFQVKAI